MSTVSRFASFLAPSLILVLAATAVVMSGCGSGAQRAQATSDGLAESRVEAGNGGKQIDDTLASLATLVGEPQGDRTKAYAAFAGNAEDIRELAKDIDGQAKDLTERSTTYFATWETDNAAISDQSMRAAGAERRNDLVRRFADVTDAYQDTQRSLQPFVANLTDIEKYLGNDLSTNGIDTVAPAAVKAQEQGADVKRGLAAIQSRIDALSTAMGATRPQ